MSSSTRTYVLVKPNKNRDTPYKTTADYYHGIKEIMEHHNISRQTVWRIMNGTAGKRFDDWVIYVNN